MAKTMRNGVVECQVCGSKVDPSVNHRSVSKAYDKAYDRHRSDLSSKLRFLNVLLVVSDCCLLGLQPILVYMSKARNQRPGEKSIISIPTIVQAARANSLLAVPAFLYAINNYLKFVMQLYFNPATTKMLSNLKVLMIALLLKFIMRRRFSVMQWEALGLLLIGISVNQLRATPTGASFGLPEAPIAYIYTLFFVTVPSLASVFNEYALKSQFDTSIYLQNLFLYGYGAIFNFVAILVTTAFKGGNSLDIFHGHSRATMLLILNNAAQGILSSFFFKYADTILKKYSSTVATIFTGLASAALFGHTLTINFILGVSIVFISMHQFFSSLSKPKDAHHENYDRYDGQMNSGSKESSLLDMAAGATEEVSHKINMRSEREPLLPT